MVVRSRSGVRRDLLLGVGTAVSLAVLVSGCGRSSVSVPGSVQETAPMTDVASTSASASGGSASVDAAAATDRTDCVGGVVGTAFQRTEPDGSHSAAVQLQPCPAGTAQKYPLQTYATLSFLGASGKAARVEVRHSDADQPAEKMDTSVPVCLVLRWPAEPVGAPVAVDRVSVAGGASHPAMTFRLPMTLGSTSGVDQSRWVADSGGCLGNG